MQNNAGSKSLMSTVCILILIVWSVTVFAQNSRVVKITVGQSEVLDFTRNIKRIAVANPEIADATVTTPNQALVTGKELGTTNLYVWNEVEKYERIKLIVVNEAAPYQVSIQVKFLEVNRTGVLEFGSDMLIKGLKVGNKEEKINIGQYAGEVNAPSDPLALGSMVDFFVQVPGQNFAAIFKALQEKNLVTLLAAPSLTARDGTEASFLAGGEFPIPIVSGASGMQQVTIQFKEYGIRLKFTPMVLSMDMVNLLVEAEVSLLDFDNGIIMSGFRIPALDTRKTGTTVELKLNDYLILGGLLSKNMSKTLARIPVLGHIPVLGKLFSSTRYSNEETELLVTVCPKLITSSTTEPVIKLPDKL